MRTDGEIQAELDKAPSLKPPPKGNGHAPGFLDYVISAAVLEVLKFDPVAFVVADILPRGLTILSAPPKIGKTWLDMGMADAVSAGTVFGGCKPVDQGDVLLLDLEGNRRRAQRRFRVIRQGRDAPANLDIANDWPRMDQGGVDMIREWAKARSKPRLVIIDIWARFRPPRPKNVDPYQFDIDTMKELQALANEIGVAIVLVHHNRKAADVDWINEIGGSLGGAGTADNLMTIRRDRGSSDAVLRVVGRDVDDTELAMAFDKNTGRWTIIGDAAEHRMNQTRRRIFDLLEHQGPKTPKEVADELEIKRETAKKTLQRMFKDGTVTCRDGRYAAAAGTP